jgi:SAM-dependent methyltransferase
MSRTPSKVLDEIADLMDPSKKDVFVDLGSGDGRLVFKMYERGHGKCIGYDISPLSIIWANVIRTFRFPLQKEIIFDAQNVFKADISKATMVYCFLDEKSMGILGPKLEEFVKNGGEVYSYMYNVDGMKGEKKMELSNGKELYIYK